MTEAGPTTETPYNINIHNEIGVKNSDSITKNIP
jgi:hypothetical protein